MLNKLIEVCIESLGLESPYEIILKPKMKSAASYIAHYSRDTLKKHVIRINVTNLEYDVRGINELIAHEFIHAWQEENNIDDVHGKPFQRMAHILEEDIAEAGIEIGKLYIDGVDV